MLGRGGPGRPVISKTMFVFKEQSHILTRVTLRKRKHYNAVSVAVDKY